MSTPPPFLSLESLKHLQYVLHISLSYMYLCSRQTDEKRGNSMKNIGQTIFLDEFVILLLIWKKKSVKYSPTYIGMKK
jgi:hypothetical protein